MQHDDHEGGSARTIGPAINTTSTINNAVLEALGEKELKPGQFAARLHPSHFNSIDGSSLRRPDSAGGPQDPALLQPQHSAKAEPSKYPTMCSALLLPGRKRSQPTGGWGSEQGTRTIIKQDESTNSDGGETLGHGTVNAEKGQEKPTTLATTATAATAAKVILPCVPADASCNNKLEAKASVKKAYGNDAASSSSDGSGDQPGDDRLVDVGAGGTSSSRSDERGGGGTISVSLRSVTDVEDDAPIIVEGRKEVHAPVQVSCLGDFQFTFEVLSALLIRV